MRVRDPPTYMKIQKEKRNRKEYVQGLEERVVGQMVRSITGGTEGGEEKRHKRTQNQQKQEGELSQSLGESQSRRSYRNICQRTGRGRGVVRKYGMSRHIYRRKGDAGELEGVRRASW